MTINDLKYWYLTLLLCSKPLMLDYRSSYHCNNLSCSCSLLKLLIILQVSIGDMIIGDMIACDNKNISFLCSMLIVCILYLIVIFYFSSVYSYVIRDYCEPDYYLLEAKASQYIFNASWLIFKYNEHDY